MQLRGSFRHLASWTFALAIIACASNPVHAQVTGNTTRVRPDTGKPRPDSTKPGADSALKMADSALKAMGNASTDTSMITTMAGIYTAEQASKGKDVYLTACVSCHTPPDHTGGSFWGDLVGKKLSGFFTYLRENMPQDNPGANSDDDYVNVLTYILQLNSMPPGQKPLPPDTTVLSKIRIVLPDTTKKGP